MLTIDSFVPDDQSAKLALIADAADILTPSLLPPTNARPATPAEIRTAAQSALAQIDPALHLLPQGDPLDAIAGDLGAIAHAPDSTVRAVDGALTRFLPLELDHLRTALGAAPATVSSVPTDIARDWLLPNGQARVEVLPVATARNSQGLHQFVADVTRVAPDAGGTAVTVVATSDTIVGAFRSAAVAALFAIAVILVVALRRLRDAMLVLAPLLLSAALTVLVMVTAAAAAELRQYHRAATAARCRRLVQHLFRDELAGRPAGDAGLSDSAGGGVLRAHHRYRLWLARPLGTSRHGIDGCAAVDQPRLHAGGEPCLCPGTARSAGTGARPKVVYLTSARRCVRSEVIDPREAAPVRMGVSREWGDDATRVASEITPAGLVLRVTTTTIPLLLGVSVMQCPECGSTAVKERPERTAQGFHRYSLPV